MERGRNAAYNDVVRSTQGAGASASEASLGFDDLVSSAKSMAVAFAGVFTAKRALDDFSKSTLPGAAEFNVATFKMRESVKRLSESFGEFLAPGAMLFTNILEGLANKLEPMLRVVSAFKQSSTDFLLALGRNALGAFRDLLPNVAKIFDGVMAWWNQNVNFAAQFEKIRAAWNKTWTAIGEFVAPILVRQAALFDTLAGAIRTGLAWALDFVKDKFSGFGQGIDIKGFADAAQAVAVVFVGTAEFAIKNWRMVMEIMSTSAALGIEFLRNNFAMLGGYISQVFANIGSDIVTILTQSAMRLMPTLEGIAKNFSDVFGATFDSLFDAIGKKFGRLAQSMYYDMAELTGMLTGQPYMRRPDDWTATVSSMIVPPDFSKFSKVPLPDVTTPFAGLRGIPQQPNWNTSATQDALLKSLDGLTTAFNQGVIGQIANTALDSQKFLANLLANLPAVNAQVAPRLDRNEPIGALLYGTTAAAMRESNQASKNPLVPIAQQQLQVSQAQLVQQQAAARAAARKARIANF